MMYGFGVPEYRAGIAVPPAPVIAPPYPLVVDPLLGNDGNLGTRAFPMLDIRTAIRRCLPWPGWKIAVVRRPTAPFRYQIDFAGAGDLIIDGWDNEPWLARGSDNISGSWVSVSGSIWRRAITYSTTRNIIITTLTETVGDRLFPVKLAENTATPTTPSPGQMGFVTGFFYVNLPDGSNPNLHDIECASRNFIFTANGAGMLTLRNLDARYALNTAIQNGNSTNPPGYGKLTVEDSYVEFGGGTGGVGANGNNELTICRNVQSYRCDNDAFQIHVTPAAGVTSGSAIMRLYGCDGSYSGSVAGASAQGASPHEHSIMQIYGGRYAWNVSGAMVSIDTARCDIIGNSEWGPYLAEHNMRLGNGPSPVSGQAGLAWMFSSGGTITSSTPGDVTVRDGLGRGILVSTPGNVVNVSAIQSINNALPDIT